jgi:hypothetical protein
MTKPNINLTLNQLYLWTPKYFNIYFIPRKAFRTYYKGDSFHFHDNGEDFEIRLNREMPWTAESFQIKICNGGDMKRAIKKVFK